MSKDLVVDGSGTSTIAGATISGGNALTFKSSTLGTSGSLAWNGGIIGVDTTVETSDSLAMSNDADKTLDGKPFTVSPTSAVWPF